MNEAMTSPNPAQKDLLTMRITGLHRQIAALLGLLLLLGLSGCSPYRNALPAQCVGPNYFDATRASKEPINFTRLRQEPPAAYLLGPRDILGVYIEGILPPERPGESVPPPVHFPERESENLPPSIGYPIPIREDGTISLPLIPPISLTGLTLPQAEYAIRKAYTVDQRILRPDEARIIVTIMRPRTYQILMVREDADINGYVAARSGPGLEPQRRGLTRQVSLPAYENDVLHALSESGGLPGNDAKSEVIILRGAGTNPHAQDQAQRAIEDPLTRAQLFASTPNITRIPLRIGPHDPVVNLSQEDIILHTGDICFVQSRESEVFYTGGLLHGGQFPIPRDYDLDVLGAISIAGGSITASAGGNINASGYHSGVGSIFPPTQVIVIRTLKGKMETIKLSLKTAVTDPHQRILVQPNDLIMLEYTTFELVMNTMLNNVNLNFSLNQLFSH
jgi:protein involved in polysaccharide export with SLBB domain